MTSCCTASGTSGFFNGLKLCCERNAFLARGVARWTPALSFCGNKMTVKKEFSPEQWAKARHLYEQTLVPVADIAASLGVSDAWLYKKIKDLQWRKRQSKSGDFHFARFLAEAEALA